MSRFQWCRIGRFLLVGSRGILRAFRWRRSTKTALITIILRFALILAIAANSAGIANSQQPASTEASTNAKNTADMLKAIDDLTEQNRRLEKQNQQLMDQIGALRQALIERSGISESSADKPAASSSSERATNETAANESTASAEKKSQDASAQSKSPQTKTGPKEGDEGYQEPTMWGEWNPGPGFKVASTEKGDLNLSGYMVARYLNQLPGEQTAVDHLGRPIAVQARQDFQFHRVMLYASGWFLNPKFKYFTFVWTVNDTTQVAVGGALSYDFNKHFQLGLGINGLPVTRTIQGNHPFWPSYDRMMADEFFRPFFTQGLFGGGELLHRLYYKWMTGNNLSTLGVRATQLTRELNFGGSLTWMPTTGEFGPRGALGDFEDHEKLATRFGIGYGVSRENRQSNENDPTNNTTIRLADSLNIFDPNTFVNGVTVQKATWHLLAGDIGFKKRGLWIGAEGYYRLLNDFTTTGGPLPVRNVRDTGFYVQSTYMVVPKLVEVYAGTSYVFSHFGAPKEFLYGGNWYPAKNRQWRLNLHIISIDRSPVSSTFGFYMGQLKGTIVAAGVTALY